MNLAEFRSKYPQYNDLSDKQLADSLHAKFYSDLPINEFYKRVGFAGSTERTWGETAGDIGAAALKGTGQILQFPGQLAGLVPGLRGFGEAIAAPGAALEEFGQGLKSAGLKAREALRNQALSEAEKEGFLAEFGTAIVETIKDPALISTFLTEQVPQLLGPGAAVKLTTMLGRGAVARAAEGEARKLAEKALRERAAAAAVGTGAAAQGADVGSDTYKAVYELAIKQGMSEEDARAVAMEKARIAALEAGAIALATSRISGGSAIERRLAGLPGSKVPGAGRIGVGLKEAGTEALEEAGGAFAKGVGMAEVDPTISPLVGVGTAAGLGALGGFGLGTIVGGHPTATTRGEAPAPIDIARQQEAKKEADRAAKAAAAAAATTPTPPGTTEPAAGANAPAAPTAGAPATPPTVLDDATVRGLGFAPGKGKRKTFYDKLLNKDLSDPKDLETVRTLLGNFVEKARNQGPELKGAALKASKFLETLPPKAEPAAAAPAAPAAPPTATEATTPTVEEEAAPSTTPLGIEESITLPVVGFTTSKGSLYEVTPEGKTIRTKKSPGRGQGQTYEPHSTLYVQPGDHTELMSDMQSGMGQNSIRIGYVLNDQFIPVSDASKIATDAVPAVAVVSKTDNKIVGLYNAKLQPEVGLHPVEKLYLSDGTSSTHVGNAITDVRRKTVEPAPKETPSAPNVPTEPATSGAGVSVAGGPAAVSTTKESGVPGAVRVVPPVEDAGQPAGGERAKPPAVKPKPAEAKPAEAKPAAVTPKRAEAKPVEYTEEDIDRAVEAGLFTEEQAELYRAELRGEEAPQTAMGAAFERKVTELQTQLNALKQKNGRAPAPKSKNRAKYDELKAQLDTLLTSEKGDLVSRLEKMGASGVIGAKGERPIIDLDAVRENLLKARAKPSMYQAVLAYIGVDADGHYLPTTYSRGEAAKLANLEESSGANVSRVAEALGVSPEVISRFRAGQTDIIVRGKNVSEAGTGATDLQPSRGVLYKAPKVTLSAEEKKATTEEKKELQKVDVEKLNEKDKKEHEEKVKSIDKKLEDAEPRATKFLQPALTDTGALDFSKLTDKQVAEIYARASNYDPSRKGNLDIIKQLNAEIAERTKKDRKGMRAALDSAYKVVRQEEETEQEEAAIEQAEEKSLEPNVREGRTGARRLKGEEKASLREEEEEDTPKYRSIPQTPLVENRVSDAELRKTVADIEQALGGEADITILDDVTELDNKEIPGTRAGAVRDGKIYLFRSGIADGVEGLKTIFHEIFHKGLANLLPPAEYRALMTKLYNQSAAVRQAADAYLASEGGKKDTEGMSPQEARVLAVEESLADMAEATNLTGSTLRQLGNFFARLADRFGMPKLARAIRTMGLDPLQAFIRDAIQAGIQPGKAGTSRFRTVTPQTEAAVAGVDVIGEAPKKTLADYLKRNLPVDLRVKVSDSLGSMDDLFTKGYAGKVRDAVGNLNPMVLISRALDHGRVALEAMRIGSIGLKDGLVQAIELTIPEDSRDFGLIAGKTVSYQRDVIGRIAEEAKAAGETFKSYLKKIDTVLYGHREYNLREHNRQVEAQAQALEAAGKQKEADKLREDQIIELFIKDDAKLDELEQEFQNNIALQTLSQTLDAIRFKALDTLVETNRISPELAQAYKDNIGYIPIKRIVEYDSAFANAKGSNRGIAALKNRKNIEGSERQTTSVVENFADFMQWASKESMMNQAALSALKDMVLLRAAVRGANNAVGATGANVKVYDKGEVVEYYVPDPANVVAFSLNDPQISGIWKAAQKSSQILRAGVTSLPPFAVKQIFDDITRAYAYSGVKEPGKLVARILFNFPATWFREAFGLKHNASIRELARLGVIGTYDFGTQGNLRNIMEEAGAEKRSTGRTILRFMEAGAKASDVAVRQAIYDQVLSETGDVAAAESRAREIINFSRRGSAKFIGTAVSIIPFFNAYARGMDKLAVAAAGGIVGQSTGQARAMFYKRMAYLTATGFMYALMMSDDEEYQKLPDHVRDTNWILPYGKYLGFVPSIPVPSELAYFFKAISERVVRYYKLQGTREEQLAVDVLANLARRGIDVFSSPNITPQIIRPLWENITNYSWFLNRPLESQGQLALDPFQRYGVGTSEFLKMTAEKLDEFGREHGIDLVRVSPIKLENAIRGLLGTTAGVALSMADAVVNPTRTDRPLHQQLKAQLTGASALMKDPTASRMIDDIYQLEKEVDQANSTYKRLVEKEPEKADDYAKRNIGMMSIRPAVKDLMKSIKALNDEAMLIDKTKEIASDARRSLINDLKAQQHLLAREVYALRTQAWRTQRGL